MRIADLNPHIRFAEKITYSSKNQTVSVKDCRLFYILNGSGKITINDNEFSLSHNTIFYCCGGAIYTLVAETPLHLLSLNFDLSQSHKTYINTFAPQPFDGTNPTSPIDPCNIHDSYFLNSFFILKNGTEFKNYVTAIVKEFSSQNLFFRESSGNLLKKILIDLHKKNPDNPDDSFDIVNDLVTYIHSNFSKEIKNQDLAAIAGYHSYYLNRLFIKQMGVSMHKYILNLRVTEGKRLLLNTTMTIADIATRIGFNSHTHFSTYFKKETNMTPFNYRNTFKNNV